MPPPEDPAVVDKSHEVVDTLHGIFGSHPGKRPAHAKGILIHGTFDPTYEASRLSTAPHFNQICIPVIARLFSSTGLPDLSDTDPNGNPRGLALRFMLEESPQHVHTDIFTHSTPFFPARNGPKTLAFIQAVASGTLSYFLPTHSAAQTFAQARKPFPESFATENPSKLILSFLFRPGANARMVTFELFTQMAQHGDVTDDCTVLWPESRAEVKLGQVHLHSVMEDNETEQKRIIFDSVPRVEGIEPSGDPLIDTRAAAYLISGRERHAA
ncbi:hypothetical protein CBS147320_6623 [Aspergillus niger]|nr:hypothetical protein CBS133816_2981 [Aspergillus niger]KAI2839362.1 hypothetical protein CBS11350_7617 [Aspergillus niger]KAI2915892.1 hypothetical protein CBS147371_5598 [Aspergillus niger]KAI2924329.1 hypothetical protein CBS147320_6623 [Aspergillus niger]KAI2939356.1 hypothetical protein CBS147322_10227 [Aspergillus niger]